MKCRLAASSGMGLAILVVCASSGQAWATPDDVKANVVIVRPHYHEQTQKAFVVLAETLDELAAKVGDDKSQLRDLFKALAQDYRYQSTSPGFGSGWFWVSPRTHQ